jgi:hypothetical protein
MSIQWTNINRQGALQMYKLSSDKKTIIVTCHDVHSYSITYDKENNVQSLDPNGGPRFSVGGTIHHDQPWIIDKIVSHKKNKSIAVFVFIPKTCS